MKTDREALKRAVLELIASDEEFRLAIAGAIGLGEILEELRKLREKSLEYMKELKSIGEKLGRYDKRFEAIERKLLEHDRRFEAIERKLMEHDKRFEVIEKKLMEHDKRFEAIERKLLEHDRRFEVIERKLLEHDKRFEVIERKLLGHDEKFRVVLEEIKKLWETIHVFSRELQAFNKRLSNVEDSLGTLTEAAFSWFVMSEINSMLESGERVLSRTRNARIDGEEVDLLIETTQRVFVVEVKVKPRHSHVGALASKGEIVARKYGKRVELVLAGSRIGREIAEYAQNRGVRVLSY